MTVMSQSGRAAFDCDGAAVEFDFSFPVLSEEEVRAVVRDKQSGAETELSLGGDYSVSGINEGRGGTLLCPLSGDPLPAGVELHVYRLPDFTQEYDLVENDAFSADLLEEQLDRAVMRDQWLQDQIDRCVKFEVSRSAEEVEDPVLFMSRAVEARDSALQSAALAEAAAGEAALSEDAAESAGLAAQSSADQAQGWAETGEDVPVQPGEDPVYSAKHWAFKAMRAVLEETADATEEFKGKVELADAAEAEAGESDAVVLTPKKGLDLVLAKRELLVGRIETNLALEAFRRMIGDAQTGPDGFQDMWSDVFADATGVDPSLSSGWTHDPEECWLGPFFAAQGLIAQMDFTDESGLEFEDFKQSAAYFQVDQANSAGHFEDSAQSPVSLGSGGDCPRIVPGCAFKLVDDPVVYGISGVVGDGSADGGVLLAGGEKQAGTYALEWVRGAAAGAQGVVPAACESPEYSDLSQSGTLHQNQFTNAPENVFDGDSATYGSTLTFVQGESAVGRIFDQEQRVAGISLHQYGYYLSSVRVQAYDGQDWSDVKTFDDLSPNLEQDLIFDAPVNCMGVRAMSNSAVLGGAANWHVREITIMGAQIVRPVSVPVTVLCGPERIDCSGWSGLTGLDVVEEEDGAVLSYALSFDQGDSFKVWTGSGWRIAASNKSADHSGPDGSWRYRDGQGAWLAPYQDGGAAALSQAVQVSELNRMSAQTMRGMTSEQIQAESGWSQGTEAVDLGASFILSDPSQVPSLERADLEYDVATSDLNLVFDGFEATEAPTSCKAAILAECCEGGGLVESGGGEGDIVLNQDLIVRASQDDGQTWDQVPLAIEGEFAPDKKILAGEAEFATGAGRVARLKVESQGQKRFKLHAAAHMMRF